MYMYEIVTCLNVWRASCQGRNCMYAKKHVRTTWWQTSIVESLFYRRETLYNCLLPGALPLDPFHLSFLNLTLPWRLPPEAPLSTSAYSKILPRCAPGCQCFGGSHKYLSLVMRKPPFCKCENKDADQLRSNCAADQRLCFRYTDSTIPLLPKSEISSL